MSAWNAWATTIGLSLLLVLVLFHLGINVTSMLGVALHGAEHVLGMPL